MYSFLVLFLENSISKTLAADFHKDDDGLFVINWLLTTLKLRVIILKLAFNFMMKY